MKDLPKKHKKTIIKFAREYESLCIPRRVIVTIPVKLDISWKCNNKIEFFNSPVLNKKDFEQASEIVEINNEIANFINRTETWSRKHYSKKNWLWENVLWDYAPEIGQVFNPKDYNWI